MTSSQIIIEVRPLAAMIPSVNVARRTGAGNACFLYALRKAAWLDKDVFLKVARPFEGQLRISGPLEANI